MWSFATPVGANQDEPAQLVKAASVARGEIVGSVPTGKMTIRAARWGLGSCQIVALAPICDKAVTVVTVPQSFADLWFPCYRLFVVEPAGCGRGLDESNRDAMATTYVGHYPPLYYAIVGLPSLVWNGDSAVYLMRVVSGLLSAIFIGLAFALAAIWSRSQSLVLALGLAATPMVVIFGAEVNPSGLEMSTAICVWTGGLILVLERGRRTPVSLVMGTACAAVVMVLSRGLSPLWLAVVTAFLVALSPRSPLLLFRPRRVHMPAGAVVAAGLAAVTYIVIAHGLAVYPVGEQIPAATSESRIIELVLGRTGRIMNEFVGTVGWNEESPPLLVTALWVLPASAILSLGLVTSLRRHAAIILGLITASLLIPAMLMVSQARSHGIIWQARDGFPLYAGILLVPGAVAGRAWAVQTSESSSDIKARMQSRFALLVASCIGVVQLGDFVWALRRYTVGLGMTVNPFARVPGGWSPPIPSIILVTGASVAILIYCWSLARQTLHMRKHVIPGDVALSPADTSVPLL